jgi:NADPH-dependent 2,4-dienoyl-CoA reductase/sulfur reductase-like enzyme
MRRPEVRMSERLVVIGGDAGGMSAAAQARRMRAADDLEIVVFERGSFTSYAACGLPYLIGGEVAEVDDLVARTPEAFRASGIDARTRHEVVAVDTDRRTVEVVDLDAGTSAAEPYDELLIATGAVPVRPPLPGIDAAGVFDLRTIPDAIALEAALDGARRAVVVGAGYIGVEVAEAFRLRGLEVTVMELADQPMVTLDADMAAGVTEALDRLGVDLRLGQGVQAFEVDGGGAVTGVLTPDATLPAEVVVVALGARPNVALAEAAGVPIGPSGGIVVDPRMRTRVPHVWAAGDCVESTHRVTGRPVNIALGTHANKQGRAAGTNLGGGQATFGGVLGTAITRVGDVEVARTGLNEREAAAAGFGFVAATNTAGTRAHYYPGSSSATVKLVAERGTGRLLGGQIVGGEGAGKRIDVIATALWNEMTVADLGGVDLAYAPPFSPVWDPVLLAAGRAAAAVVAAGPQ